MAEFERHLIVERTTGALEQAASQGRPHGGVRPFGFQEGDRITHVEAEANLIREAARRALEGDSISSICNEWNEGEVPTSIGGTWRPRTLRGILESPRIMGKRSHGESLNGAQWEAIIDEATWRKLQTTFRGRRRGPNRDSHPLSGILRCDECGDSLAIGYVRSDASTEPTTRGRTRPPVVMPGASTWIWLIC